jgi:hypothetical protein
VQTELVALVNVAGLVKVTEPFARRVRRSGALDDVGIGLERATRVEYACLTGRACCSGGSRNDGVRRTHYHSTWTHLLSRKDSKSCSSPDSSAMQRHDHARRLRAPLRAR